jgi:hypothetical protein
MLMIKPATLKTLVKSKLEMTKSELNKGFPEFYAYLEKMAIIHDKHGHVVDHKKTGDSGTNNMAKNSDAGFRSTGHSPAGNSSGGGNKKTSDRDRTKSGNGRSSDSSGTLKQSNWESPPCFNTKKCTDEKDYLSDCPHTSKDKTKVIFAKCK